MAVVYQMYKTGCQLCLHNSKQVSCSLNYFHGQFLNLVASEDFKPDILRKMRYTDSPKKSHLFNQLIACTINPVPQDIGVKAITQKEKV